MYDRRFTMKRSNTMTVLSHDIKKKVVYHEAGHATGIHFSSIQKNLPSVFFEITFKQIEDSSFNSLLSDLFDPHIDIARVKGGRLIESLPLMTFKTSNVQSSTDTDKWVFKYTDEYLIAFEADITNLLIGPLAEAKYTALVDDEPFHQALFTVQALKYYGGDADLAVINDYLQSYSADKQEQHNILNQIFIKAFNFVNDDSNWKAISKLANYILTSNKNVIGCEEVATVLNGI
jgi:hypothetical protein